MSALDGACARVIDRLTVFLGHVILLNKVCVLVGGIVCNPACDVNEIVGDVSSLKLLCKVDDILGSAGLVRTGCNELRNIGV